MAKEKTREELLAKMRGNLGVELLDEESEAPAVQQVIQQPVKNTVASTPAKAKEEKERKIRSSVALYPSQLRDIKRIAYINRVSVSEVLCSFADKYIKSNQAALEEFKSLPHQIQQKVDSSR